MKLDQGTRLIIFLEFVSTLTGISQKVVGQAESAAEYMEHFATMANQMPTRQGSADDLLLLYAGVRSNLPPDQAVSAILSGAYDSPTKTPKDWPFSGMSRSLMNFVLLGMWFNPNDPNDEGMIMTSALYAESLVWLIAQAHPVGASKLAYGHWAGPPPALKKLIG